MNQKLSYLASSIRKTLAGQGFACPSCGSPRSCLVKRKYLVTALRRCDACHLQFRTPTTGVDENRSFYQEKYTQGFTTDCPADDTLQSYLRVGFKGTVRDYGKYVEVIRSAAGPARLRLFEFGCSWGYGSWQFQQAGFDVEAFEISSPRAEYARQRLGVRVHADLAGVGDGFDVFFSSHVLEHVPSVAQAIAFGLRILRPGGLFVAITPNGSQGFRDAAPRQWDRMWGQVHPNFIDDRYWQRQLPGRSKLLLSNPYDLGLVARWAQGGTPEAAGGALRGDELLVLSKRGPATPDVACGVGPADRAERAVP